MIKEIKYNGYTTEPSDYECPDGDLASAVNLVQEDGALSLVAKPRTVLTLSAGSKVLYLHKTSAFTHYIVLAPDGTLRWVDGQTADAVTLRTNAAGVSRADSLGNTLMLFAADAIIYYLWKDGAYKCLGDHLPDIQLSFGLKGYPRLYSISGEEKSTFKVTFEPIPVDDIESTFTEDNKREITSQVMAKVNKFVADQTVRKGRFCFPFFVRYALRLYDGSLVCHSAPVLMNPSTTVGPVVLWKRIKGSGKEYTEADMDIMLVAAALDFRTLYNDDMAAIDDWSDIVKGVDVYISKPVYTYDQEGQCDSFMDSDNMNSVFIGSLSYDGLCENGDTPKEGNLIKPFASYDFVNYYAEWRYWHIYEMYFSSDRVAPWTVLHLPEFGEENKTDLLRNVCNFYKLQTLTMDWLKGARYVRSNIEIEEDFLQSLVNRETMTDDYLTHDRLQADRSFQYNNRVNLSGVRRTLYKGFNIASMFAYKNADVTAFDADSSTKKVTVSLTAGSDNRYAVAVQVNENGESRTVLNNESLWTGLGLFMNYGSDSWKRSWGCYVFYPNANASKMTIEYKEHYRYEVELQPHEFLNGAYGIIDYDIGRSSAYYMAALSPSGSTTIDVPGKVYTSEVNNPFYFPLSGINSVGTGRIVGICAAVKALSQGQFGQFPLYAFSTDGVWALEVASDGAYSARQPVTRDVCVNPDSITQMDSSVLFATDRGVMLLSGSSSKCISDAIFTDEAFSVTDLPGGDKLVELAGAADAGIEALPFSRFLSGCRMVYDYVHQRVIAYNPSAGHAYVYSLKSGSWGMMQSDIASDVDAYPEALAVTKDGRLVDYSASGGSSGEGGGTESGASGALMVTRPLKLDSPNTLKTVSAVIQRGHFRKGHVMSVLYGSRDLFNWHLVASSRTERLAGFSGTPYKYFRVALVCDLDEGESVYGCSVQYAERFTNRLR